MAGRGYTSPEELFSSVKEFFMNATFEDEEIKQYFTPSEIGKMRKESLGYAATMTMKLRECIKESIDEYGARFSRRLVPALLSSNVVPRRISVSNEDTFIYEFGFDEDMAKAKSITGKPEYEGNLVDLAQGGWRVKKEVWYKLIPHFGYESPIDYIGKAIDKFRTKYDRNHSIKITVSGARSVRPRDTESLSIEDVPGLKMGN